VKQDDGCWIEEVPGINCQEATRQELVESLRVTLAETIEMKRKEARRAAGRCFEELLQYKAPPSAAAHNTTVQRFVSTE
jgi:hypothetical protein